MSLNVAFAKIGAIIIIRTYQHKRSIMNSPKHYYDFGHKEILQNQILLSGLSDEEIFMFIQFAEPSYITLKKGQTYRTQSSFQHMICLSLSGEVCIYSIDYSGNRSLIKYLHGGETSGTIYTMLDYYNSVIEIYAKTDIEALFLDPEKLFITDERLAIIQHKILVNMLAAERQMFIDISEHISCLSQRSIRDKILKYLMIACENAHSYDLYLPFSREDLASYLSVDRASLSRTLGELKRDKIIDYNKNHFKILDTKSFKY